MIFSPQNLVYVYYNGLKDKQLMGRLLLKDRQIFFEYDARFIKLGLELSPFKLPLKSVVIISNDRTFDGLFGVFNDSLPDGWGKLLIDRKLMSLAITPDTLSPLDRLVFVGNQGMGALSYEPDKQLTDKSLLNDLDDIDDEIQSYQEKESDRYVDDLLSLGGSSAGARPKILLRINNNDWLIKFRSTADPQDIGNIELAYYFMAIEAGLNVPEAKLFPSRKGLGFFGSKRFDRKENKHIHMHTIAGLLHADHRYPSLDYETIMKATLHLTRDIRECENQFRNAVFNIFTHNRDDHSKNFSFLMDEQGVWNVSPAYDLTFSSGPSGEHSTMVMGEGKKPKLEHLLRLAVIGQINKEKAIEIINQVCGVTEQFETFADKAGISSAQTNFIKNKLKNLIKEIHS